jgi:hypothetical protein
LIGFTFLQVWILVGFSPFPFRESVLDIGFFGFCHHLKGGSWILDFFGFYPHLKGGTRILDFFGFFLCFLKLRHWILVVGFHWDNEFSFLFFLIGYWIWLFLWILFVDQLSYTKMRRFVVVHKSSIALFSR